ncbi:DUF6153 family protein [Streptomyces sp. NPDC000151]|uniref:DUF6153 family protein n=1 Tax=Streptomyces sp. NPDC000151 TaxID=3154244 RepID=UPI003319DA61
MQTAGAWGHLLLVVVLALGVFVMHTVGHPRDTSGPAMGAAAHAPAMTTHGNAGNDAAGTVSPQYVTAAAHASEHNTKTSSNAPGAGMDMTSLCVAVLGAGILLGLLRAALARREDWLVRLRAEVLAALRPNAPPPRPPDLAHLSVLRI